MTIGDVFFQLEQVKPNQFGDTMIINWLNDLDRYIHENIITQHEGHEAIPFIGYDADSAYETVLLVPEPYATIYLLYLMVQIDFFNGDMIRYNNSMAMYNNAYDLYAVSYTKKHMPLQKNKIINY